MAGAGASSAARPGLRPVITLVHASALIVLGIALAINSIVGGFWGAGSYPFFLTNHIGAVGLMQAYLLMSLMGVAIWIGFRTNNPFSRLWHPLLIVAHLIPLLAVALFMSSTPEMTLGVAMISFGIHAVGISAEVFAMTRKE